MSESFNQSMNTLFEKMHQFISTKTVVGEPSHIGDVIIVPLVDVSFGVGTGEKSSDTGAGGLGAKITPSAILVIQDGNVQLVNVKNQDSINKLIDMVPGVLSKFNFGPFSKTPEKSEKPSKTDDDLKDRIITEP